MALIDRFRGLWNAFLSDDNHRLEQYNSYGRSTSQIPDRPRVRIAQDRSTLAAIYNKLAVDASGVQVRHVLVDDADRYVSEKRSDLHYALTLEPNKDQGPRAFRMDLFLTLFDAGVAAIVPIDGLMDTDTGLLSDIRTMRVGRVLEYFPEHVKVEVYDETRGERRAIVIAKKNCAIVTNPFYTVMNETNSTLTRLAKKLGLLDYVDEQSSSGKLDIIIQLPYVIKSDARREQAERRREDIEVQLRGSKYGIAYTDGTEKITQLNRPAENNLLAQVDGLINKLYTELGITAEIMSGTADEAAMTNYYNRTIYPLVEAVAEAIQRSFIGKDRTEAREKIFFVRTKMQFLAFEHLGEVVDALCRNEVVSANEVRGWLGLPPSDEPKADKLINSNMPQPDPQSDPQQTQQGIQNGT
jgi:hypothetical protein